MRCLPWPLIHVSSSSLSGAVKSSGSRWRYPTPLPIEHYRKMQLVEGRARSLVERSSTAGTVVDQIAKAHRLLQSMSIFGLAMGTFHRLLLFVFLQPSIPDRNPLSHLVV